WAYKLYADGVATRVQSSTTDPLSVALANTLSNGGAQVIVARTDRADSTAQVSVPIDLTGVQTANVKVTASLLPTSGADPLKEPLAAGEQTIPVTGGNATLQVNIAAHEGLLLTLTPA